MPVPLDAETERALIEWIDARARAGQPALAHGYQGAVHLYENDGRKLIVKIAPGGILGGRLGRWMLRREYRAYQRLDGYAGSPKCYGLLRGRYLVLDYIEGVRFRNHEIHDRDLFFGALLARIQELHDRGVAHADLKRNDNLLIVDHRRPYLIDFGAAIVRKPHFAPVNHYLFGLARRFDFNAWAKLKYRGRMEQLTAEDQAYYRRTGIEIIARAVKRSYLKLKRSILG